MYNLEILLEDLKLKRIAHMCGTHPTLNDEQYDEIIELVEKQIKHRWHNFPKDLPKSNTLVEVKFATGNYNHGIYDYYDECFAYRNVSRKDICSKVVAWRYIEPFESEV